jgi:hypothetical protein
MNDFDKWYGDTFGHLPDSQDESVKESVRKIWSSILVKVAGDFEFNDFENYTGQQAGRILRRMARQTDVNDL